LPQRTARQLHEKSFRAHRATAQISDIAKTSIPSAFLWHATFLRARCGVAANLACYGLVGVAPAAIRGASPRKKIFGENALGGGVEGLDRAQNARFGAKRFAQRCVIRACSEADSSRLTDAADMFVGVVSRAHVTRRRSDVRGAR